MKLTLKKKLSIGFLLAIIGSILITSFIANAMIGKRFNKYLIDEQKVKVANVISIVEQIYDEQNGFSRLNRDELLRYALAQELHIEVKDIKGNVIFNSGDSHLQRKNMMGGKMHGFAEMNIAQYTEEKYPLVKNNSNIGSIIIGYLGSSYISAGALAFKMTLNQSLILSAFIALLFGLLISIILSKQISKPLIKITDTANKMRDGNLEVRAELKTNTKEIHELSNSINYLAETLQQQEMLRKKLTSDMAHEIRTPLTTLKTHVEALIDGVWEPTPDRLQVFYEEIERLSKLVDNLRSLSKLEQTTLNLNKSSFNLSKELFKVIDTFEPLYSKSNFTLTSEIAESIDVTMDKDKLIQIIHNLLSNAYKYLKENGTVNILLKKEGDKIIIQVTDNGIGIPPEDLPHIFQRFYRSDASRDRNTGGSGIGLTITKALVEAHGGKIYAQSLLGEGSTFTIELPKSIMAES